MLRMCLMLCGIEREMMQWLSLKPVYGQLQYGILKVLLLRIGQCLCHNLCVHLHNWQKGMKTGCHSNIE